ncbi:unnamed protein product [Sphagnum balticum]
MRFGEIILTILQGARQFVDTFNGAVQSPSQMSPDRTLLQQQQSVFNAFTQVPPSRNGVYETYDKPKLTVLDPTYIADFAYLERLRPTASPYILSGTTDESAWLILIDDDDNPPSYWYYTRPTQANPRFGYAQSDDPLISAPNNYRTPRLATYLFTSKDVMLDYEWGNYVFGGGHNAGQSATVVLFDCAQRGGLLRVYICPPCCVQVDARDNGRTTRPVPFLLYVHGGPTGEGQLGFRSCNYRGSTGFGKRFLNAGDGEWAGKMHTDLLDAVEWAIRQRVTERETVGIWGGILLIHTVHHIGQASPTAAMPHWSASVSHRTCSSAGVDAVGPAKSCDIVGINPVILGVWPGTTAAPARRRSRNKCRARMIPRVKQAESGVCPVGHKLSYLPSVADNFVAALKRNNIPVTYLLYPDEGHFFSRPENLLSFTAYAEQFFGDCMGGRVEPIDQKTITASSVKVIENAYRG